MVSPYVAKQFGLLSPYLTGADSILDYGCGDLSLAKALKHEYPLVKITGVDVADSGVRKKGIDFLLYDGKQLPFAKKSFDTTIAYHVFHHTMHPKQSLADVVRVTRRQVLMVEPCLPAGRRFGGLDLFFMKIFDRVGNGWRAAAIPMPFTFQKEHTWIAWASALGWKVTARTSAGVLPGWLPFGETKLFILTPVR